ncbi:MAG: hypothetical protein QM765_12905 [Myxococcales bacterium]
MPYEVSLERTGKPITLDEWLSAAQECGLERSDWISAVTPQGQTIEVGLGEGGFVWHGHPDAGPRGVPFSWRRGRVKVPTRGGPDHVLLAKLRELAKKLGARLVGEEGEEL